LSKSETFKPFIKENVQMQNMSKRSASLMLKFIFGMMLFGCLSTVSAFASSNVNNATESNIQELSGPIAAIQSTIQGPIAMSIGVVALAAAGAMLVFGGEISDFVKRLVYVGCAVALTVSASSILYSLFTNTSGALI
jgi:type IV secretion system protein VirB2